MASISFWRPEAVPCEGVGVGEGLGLGDGLGEGVGEGVGPGPATGTPADDALPPPPPHAAKAGTSAIAKARVTPDEKDEIVIATRFL
ncbi:MAG: hypothetical protein AAGL10_02295 [Pseudomonadota bacterium]